MGIPGAIALAALFWISVLSGAATADAAELKVLASNALKSTLEEAGPQFEKATGNTLVIAYGAAAELKTDIEKGVPLDVAILTAAAIDDLVRDGKLAAAGRADIARSEVGVAARRGAPKPDIGTAEAFKRAMLDAHSIGYVATGATAPYIKSLFQRLGIADEVEGKLKPLPSSDPAANAVANGEAELGITQISEILPYAGAELLGPLPPELQLSTIYPAAIAINTTERDVASAFIKFLASPPAIAVLKAKGLNGG